jgi:hypothetical protein
MRRRITQIIAFLVLGAMVNIAVAWNCAWWCDLEWDTSGPIEEDPWLVAWLDARAHEYDASDWRPPPVWFADQRGWGRRQAHVSSSVSGGRIAMPADRTIVIAGWPLLTVEGDYTPEWTGGRYIYHPRGMVSLMMAGRERDSPLRPIWPGFIVNTLFYALLLWLMFFAPFAARRTRRRRRGLCEKCAYPIGTSPICTECGAAVAHSPISANHGPA